MQGELEKAIGRLFGDIRRLKVIAAGRTDAGVHAAGQVCHVDTPENLSVDTIEKGLHALLPDDIQVWRIRRVHNHFHARYWAKEREYVYRVLKQPDVFLSRHGWRPETPFDPARAAELTDVFLGRYNFKPFSTKMDKGDDPVCEVREVNWIETPEGWLFHVRADRFLRRMVRTLVSTLLHMAAGKLDPEQVREAIVSGLMTKEAWERYKRLNPLPHGPREPEIPGGMAESMEAGEIYTYEEAPPDSPLAKASGDMEPDTTPERIQSEDDLGLANKTKKLPRPVAPPAPPEGLALVRVRYDIDDEFDRHPFLTWRTDS